ncbi:unnamed protein product [Lymnaea stagnalis]|uniref:Calponin-homology (CH) domain-containing protein n=1 Tax=Lymnaea stagnalis TaxID=6523 RepID=A0AAV2HZ86_LYMST
MSIATGLLHNTGANHAYFQVCDPNPLPGLSISPVHGVVPVGGSAEIRVSLNPDSIIKFDTRIQICIKGGKTLELRIGGSVESPVINIDVGSFNFGGVFCGSAAVMPFKMENKGEIKCRVEVDLTKYKDFSISFPGYQTQEDLNFQMMNTGMASVTIDPLDTVEGEIIFTPTQVASYDFVLPLAVNYLKVRGPSPPVSTHSAKNSARVSVIQNSSMHIISPKPVSPTVDVSSKHVIATAMRQPLQLSSKKLEFILPANFNDFTTHLQMDSTKTIVLVNTSNETLTWGLDLGQSNKHLDAGTFKFLHEKGVPFISQGDTRGIEGDLEPGQSKTILVNFCPNDSGRYHVTIPVVINSDWNKPFQFLEIFGELKSAKLWFDPGKVIFTPVPLLTETSVEVTLLASNYRKKNQITVSVPNITCDDKTQISPLTVTFLNGDEIMPCNGSEAQVDPCAIPCRVTFISPKPVSFQQPIVFCDEEGQTFSLQVTATADNCLLTCYPFLALHRGDHQIVCEQGTSPKGRNLLKGVESASDTTTNSGEALLVPCTLTNQGNSRPSTSATSSNFQISSSSYESSSLIDTSATTTPGRREGAMNKPPTGSDFDGLHLALEKAVTAIFPDEDTEEGKFHMEVLMATQRWFASQGWPGGAYPILIPETLRTSISKKTASESLKMKDENLSKEQFRGNKKQKSKTSFNKLAKTIYDMISYLSGRSVPGIPINSPLPTDPLQRVKQVYWQHCTLLTFLRCQGACVAHIQPEYLMAPTEFLLWRQLQKNIKLELLRVGNDKEAAKIQLEEDVEEALFEAISKRMWTDILLQILKVLVLSKVTPKTLKAMSSPYKDVTIPMVNPDPLASNIYSVSERILLAWMNHCYETYRASIWQDCAKGGVPPSRWIVNFDYDLMDGLVLAALLGAHMPFMVKSHLEGMYTHPVTAEQCLHNALKVITAMKYAAIDFDIQAIDITDPNPINLLLLLVNLYQRLPSYLPKTTIEFVGTLHQPVIRQVKVTNTSVKSIVYNVIIAGTDAGDFTVQKGNLVTIPPKSTFAVNVEFRSRFLRAAEAVMLLVGRRHGAATGNTLSFKLVTEIDNIRPKSVTKVESPCYELKKIMLEVTNPFPEGGDFRIVLIESNPIFHENSPSTPDKVLWHLLCVDFLLASGTQFINTHTLSSLSAYARSFLGWLSVQASPLVHHNTSPNNFKSTFSTSMSVVHIESNALAEVEIDYLPFSVEDRQCSVIFLDENIGEFLCSIEATAVQPLPSYLPYVPNKNSARISSTAAAGKFSILNVQPPAGDSSIIYWRCEAGMTLKEILQIPVVNIAKERALIMASQQNMSDLELQRRQVTGTLMSCTVTSQTIKKLSNNPMAAVSIAKVAIGPVADVYRVEADSEHFKVPNLLVMPSADERKKCQALEATHSSKDKENEGFALLPVEFKAKEPGHYPTTITLRAIDDIRVYRIECTVNREGSFAEFEFSAPVNHAVTQDIPIINPTDYDWPLKVTIMGEGFTGHKEMLSKSFTTSFYTLTYRPMKEGSINGKLIMINEEDGSEQTFQLTGIGLKPLALDFIKLICGAKSNITHSVNVPNVTKSKLVFRVESNLPFITGPTSITVLPGQTNVYSFDVNPTKRGNYQGVLSFVARDNPDKEVDSDGEELSQENISKDYLGYRLWYAIEVDVKPPLPERVMKVSCACLRKTALDVIVRNPTSEQITLTATITGSDLSGPLSITLPPGEKDVYTLTFAPSHVGESSGSLIFFNAVVGEFWYDLHLKAEPPIPTTVAHMECELGKWTKQVITLKNPTNETLALALSISNTNNFSVDWESDKTVLLKQKASMDVVLRFMPTSLGDGEHLGRIIFHSDQLGDWVFIASGTGLLPRPQPPICTYTIVGSNTTVIIPFRNPTDVSVLVDILLTGTSVSIKCLFDGMPGPVSAFKLLLKHNSGVHVGPKSTLEIPISFAPNEMINYKAFCTVVVRREDGEQWPYVPQDSLGRRLSVSSTGLNKIRWLYPIHGIPESTPIKDTQPANIAGQARDLIEQRLEVTLTGTPPGSAQSSNMSMRAKTPKDKQRAIPQGVVVGNTMATADEFSFELLYPNKDIEELVNSSVSLAIIRHHRDPSSGLVTLIFSVKFSPIKEMDLQVQLHVKAATGGLWRFPLRFTATEAPVDDTILVEATGMGKLSSVGFKLTSQQMQPTPFNAFFENGSDPEFTVSPQSGELLPVDTPGTHFVINFLPNVYGKQYYAKLIVQTPDMQWSYSIKGVLPEYRPPRGISAPPISGPHPVLKKQRSKKNYIRENLKLIATAVSSPVKGAPLTKRGWHQRELISI